MKKTLFILGCLTIFSASTANAQIISPVAHLNGEISLDTQALFVGHINLPGDLQGYEIESLEYDLPFSGNINVYPLFSSTTIENINDVLIVDLEEIQNQSLENITDIENLIDLQNQDFVSHFSNVNIITEEGPFLLGTKNGSIELPSGINYAISTIMSYEIIEGNSFPFIIFLSSSQIKTRHTGQFTMLMQLAENGDVTIEGSEGNTLWNEEIGEKLVLINDSDFSVTQEPPMSLFPLYSDQKDIKITVTPSDSSNLDIPALLENVTETTSNFGDIPDFSENIEGYEDILSAATSIINGGMILVNTNDTFLVDNSPQTFSHIGFARGNQFDITYSSDTQNVDVEGDYRLIFLGDHIYTAQAKQSDDGIAIPIPLIIIWAIAIGLFLLLRFYLKKDVDEQMDEKVKKYAFIFNIIALIVAFILLDREISYQFGISAIDAILGQGISLVSAALIGLELAMWGLGFALLAIPIRMITNSGLKILFGIGKGGKGFGKGVGAISIWIFCAVYVKLVLNIILLIINPSNFFTMG